jgi:ABC-type multidrug transport system ATPase subunit
MYVYTYANTYYAYASGFDGEGRITSAIAYVTSDTHPVMYYTTGHGELDLSEAMTGAIEKANIELLPLNLLSTDIPEDCDALICFTPSADFTEAEAKKVIGYLAEGGDAFLCTILTAETPVYAGSVFRCGKRLFAAVRDGLFYTDLFPEDPAEDGILHIDIENRSIRKFFFRKKKLIENIHLDVKKGQMVLILGQAGAGKTTFMHAVNGYEKAEGTITYNGKTLEEIRKEGGGIGFVPQGDLLRPGVSVYNTLRNAARLKLAGTENDDPEIIRQKIAATLSLMGLTGKEKDLVSKLSGGEKKRLAVAAEYIGDPKLFFLDEPDSGLDGPSAERLMALLRHIADEGRIVMLISHSPDRAGSMFDRVIVLGKDPRTQCGGLAFYGSYPKTLEFFGVSKLESVVDAIGNGKENRAAEFIGRYAAMQAERGGVE